MPYASTSEVPEYVPKAKRRQWMHVWNSAYKRALKDGKSKADAEASAFAQANAVAGPNAKALGADELKALVKAIGTDSSGFLRALDGPFRCGHCRFMRYKKGDNGDGVCENSIVNGDGELKNEKHDGSDRLWVWAGDVCDKYEPVKKEKGMEIRKFVQFAKVDLTKREVWGIVTAEVPDKDNEVCDYAGTKPYYEKVIAEMSKATDGENFFPLRYMHQLDAVGKCIGFDFRDDEREIFMGFKVTDDDKWQKVVDRVLTGFSHGGKILQMADDPVYEGCKRYIASPSEVSLVDNPCLASAHFTLVKTDGTVELCKFARVLPPEPNRIEALERSLALMKAALDKISATTPAPVLKATPIVVTKAKAKTKRVAGEDLPAAAFLIVGDAEKVETWALPIEFSTEVKSQRYVRNAIVRLGSVKIATQALKDAALKKLTAAAEKYGVNVDDERTKFASVRSYLRKVARIGVNRLARKVTGGNVGYALGTLDNDMGRLTKGLFEVSRLAMLINEFSYLLNGVVNEEEWEKDADAPTPGLLADNIESMLDTLLTMVESESEELRAEVRARVQ